MENLNEKQGVMERRNQLELLAPARDDAAAKAIFAKARMVAVALVQRTQPSATEFLQTLEREVGWPVRQQLFALVAELREDRDLPAYLRDYFKFTLNDDELTEALQAGAKKVIEEKSALDELMQQAMGYRGSREFADAIAFAAKFRDYAPFNNMLVYFQNPRATYFATARDWWNRFQRRIKEDARPLLILVPFGPVMPVFDIDETEGPPLPDKLASFAEAAGAFNPQLLARTLENCERDKILIQRKTMPKLAAGFATTRLQDTRYKMRIVVRAELDDASAYSVLCHELAHIYLGHLGGDSHGWWPCRVNLTHRAVEVEAEAVAYIICKRAGLITKSAEYLATYIGGSGDLAAISIDLITRVAGQVERMAQEKLPPRRRTGVM